MRIVALAGGIGGARFLRGLRHALPDADVTVVVNTGDDMTLYGLRICPDLDTLMYTLSGAIDEEHQRARYSAVLGVLSALLIPFIHLSVYLFQARIHPMPVALQPGKPKMSDEMLVTFLSSFVVFTVLAIAFVRGRYRLALLGERVQAQLEAGA